MLLTCSEGLNLTPFELEELKGYLRLAVDLASPDTHQGWQDQ